MTPRLPLFAAAVARPLGQSVNCVPALPATATRAQNRTAYWIVNAALRLAMPTGEGSAISHGYSWPHPEGQVWAVVGELGAVLGDLE